MMGIANAAANAMHGRGGIGRGTTGETVRYSCGHYGELRVGGSYKERDRKRQWAATYGDCPDCFKAERSKLPPQVYVRLTYQLDSLKRPDGRSVEILVIGGYAQREELKARGYRFERDTATGNESVMDALNGRTQAGWVKAFRIAGEGATEEIEAQCEAELAWWIESGATVRGLDEVAGIFAALLSGRLDLVAPKPLPWMEATVSEPEEQ